MAITQNPAATLLISFGAFAYTGHHPETVDSEQEGELEHIFAAGTPLTTLAGNQVDKLTISAWISGTSVVKPAQGAIVTLTPPEGTSTKYICSASKIAFSDKAAKLQITLEKPVGLTYS
jgi:hypothetical protein